jgi:hypothetical protein
MSTPMLIIIVCAIAALLIGVILASRGSGPRVTTIEHRREHDDGKDGDDA